MTDILNWIKALAPWFVGALLYIVVCIAFASLLTYRIVRKPPVIVLKRRDR